VREAFEESLAKLDCEYIDLYLMHWPQATADASWGLDGIVRDNKCVHVSQNMTGKALPFETSPNFVETWKDMEKLLDTGIFSWSITMNKP
jgi:glycerol 2-dehydrogenase (NADP+)